MRFKRANVSAYLTSANNRFTALRAFELYACTAGANPANPTCDGTLADGWKRILRSQPDAFPVNPRPVAPDMTLRSWDLPDTTATHVKLVVLDNQCTGQASYHGDQDNDPGVNADCVVGTGTHRNTEVRAAELQILSDKGEGGRQGREGGLARRAHASHREGRRKPALVVPAPKAELRSRFVPNRPVDNPWNCCVGCRLACDRGDRISSRGGRGRG